MMNRNLKSKKAIYLKAVLFLLILILSIFLNLTSEEFNLRVVSLALIVWSSARIYYFIFYVIEHYVDGEFRFSGLFDFLKYMVKKRSKN